MSTPASSASNSNHDMNTNYSSPSSSSSSSNRFSQETVDNKILADLFVVEEKMDLCDSILRPGGGNLVPRIDTNTQDSSTTTLLSVVGFLEACAPRIIELVEAAAQGALSDTVLMKALEVNDRLTKKLADIDNTVALTDPPASSSVAAAMPAAANNHLKYASAPPPETAAATNDLFFKEEDEASSHHDNTNGRVAAAAAASAVTTATTTAKGVKTTGEEDDSDPLSLMSPPKADESETAEEDSKLGPTKSQDEFDDFFTSRAPGM